MANKRTPHRLKANPVANNGENSGLAVWRARRKANTSNRAAGVVGMTNKKIATRRARNVQAMLIGSWLLCAATLRMASLHIS
jgi:hypothetical protein